MGNAWIVAIIQKQTNSVPKIAGRCQKTWKSRIWWNFTKIRTAAATGQGVIDEANGEGDVCLTGKLISANCLSQNILDPVAKTIFLI
jgi:hypothetical protein